MSDKTKTKPRRRLQVRQTEDWLVFEVESETGDDWHRVDLEQFPLRVIHEDRVCNTTNGWCNCKQFRFRLWRKAENGMLARCKHICDARDYFLDQILADVIGRAKARARANAAAASIANPP